MCVCVQEKGSTSRRWRTHTESFGRMATYNLHILEDVRARSRRSVAGRKIFSSRYEGIVFPFLFYLAHSFPRASYDRLFLFLVCFTLSFFWQAFLRSFQCPGQWQWLPARVRNTQRAHRFLVPLFGVGDRNARTQHTHNLTASARWVGLGGSSVGVEFFTLCLIIHAPRQEITWFRSPHNLRLCTCQHTHTSMGIRSDPRQSPSRPGAAVSFWRAQQIPSVKRILCCATIKRDSAWCR